MSITTMCAGYPDTPHQVEGPGVLNGYGMCDDCSRHMRKDAIERRAAAEVEANRSQTVWAVELTQRLTWDTVTTLVSYHQTRDAAVEAIWWEMMYRSPYKYPHIVGQTWAAVPFERAS